MHHNKGITTLTALLIIASILLAGGIALHASLRNSLIMYSEDMQTSQVQSRALSCVYEGLSQLMSDVQYAGETLVLDGVSCTINVTKKGKTYMIESTAQATPWQSAYILTVERQGQTFIPSELTQTL